MNRVRIVFACVKKRPLSPEIVFLFGLVAMKEMMEFEPHPRQAGRSHKISPP
jgi:hypothetical protein